MDIITHSLTPILVLHPILGYHSGWCIVIDTKQAIWHLFRCGKLMRDSHDKTNSVAGWHKKQHLSHCGILTPYGDINLGQYWLRYWLVAWRHQAITWINVDLPYIRSAVIHLMAISQIWQPSITKIRLKMAYLKCLFNLPEVNDLT